MYQRLVLVGHLGRDPEMRYTPQGTPVTSFPVATNRKYKTADGQQKEETVWFRVSVWNKQAETANQYLTKGQQVLIEGVLVGDENGGPRVWTDKEGKPRASFEVRADNVRFMGKRDGAPAGSQSATGAAQPATGAATGEVSAEEPTSSEELPF